MRNKLTDLNNHLFATLEALYDGDMKVDHAKAISDIASRIIEVKKVECFQANILLKAGYHDTVAKQMLNNLQLPTGGHDKIDGNG